MTQWNRAKKLNATQNNKKVLENYQLYEFFPDQVQKSAENLPNRDGKITGDSYDIQEVTPQMIEAQVRKYQAGVNHGGVVHHRGGSGEGGGSVRREEG